MRSCANPELPPIAATTIKMLTCAECDSILHQIRSSDQSQSPIFNDMCVGDDVVPAGAFIIVISEILTSTSKTFKSGKISIDQVHSVLSECISALIQSKNSVFGVICAEYSEPSHNTYTDPRPSLTEAWFLTINSLMLLFHKTDDILLNHKSDVQQLISETLAACVQIILMKRLEKEAPTPGKSVTPLGMSLDGPQSLALVEFIELALGTGQDIFTSLANLFRESKLHYACIGSDVTLSETLVGGAILAATLFRGCSGALPPWAIESVPHVYASLCDACGNVDTFCLVLKAGARLRLQPTPDAVMGCVHPNKKLAGYFFDQLNDKGETAFLEKAHEVSSRKDNGKWRYFKVLLKAVCGKSTTRSYVRYFLGITPFF